jgi:PHD/YefM family antitoxin component YafN of YafNO toxin-antitoxin module
MPMINLDRDIDSLTNFKRDTTRFLHQLKENGQPIVLTINGKAELVVQDARSYQKLLELAERLETIEGVRAGLEDMKAGRGRPAEKVLEEIRREFRIPRDA